MIFKVDFIMVVIAVIVMASLKHWEFERVDNNFIITINY